MCDLNNGPWQEMCCAEFEHHSDHAWQLHCLFILFYLFVFVVKGLVILQGKWTWSDQKRGLWALVSLWEIKMVDVQAGTFWGENCNRSEDILFSISHQCLGVSISWSLTDFTAKASETNNCVIFQLTPTPQSEDGTIRCWKIEPVAPLPFLLDSPSVSSLHCHS